ncbi:MAG TPA: prepilin-type N-terminal cleavage/methylation domain-containing protein [Nitrospiraceae bacterium]
MMPRHSRVEGPNGFTMIEVMIVVAILGILAAVATVSYNHFVTKAKNVEGEIVVHEVERLEHLYHVANQTYTDNLADLGLAMTGTLKYYTPEVRTGFATDKMSYQVRALPGTTSGTDAWLLTRYRDGSVQVDRIPMIDLQAFATARYLGTAPVISRGAGTGVSGSGIPGNNEPEWSGDGSSSQCQECGRVVRHEQ